MLKFMLLKNEIFKRQKKKNTLCHDQILDKQKHPGEFSCLSRIWSFKFPKNNKLFTVI